MHRSSRSAAAGRFRCGPLLLCNADRTCRRCPIGHGLARAAFAAGLQLAILAESTGVVRTWGEWRDAICQARAPLGTFLSIGTIACAIDNVAVRMLLWPDPRIPVDAFINPRHDAPLIEAALERLNQFAFVDVVENPSLRTNLQNWLGRRVTYPRLNETSFMPESLRSPLSHELTPEATHLLEQRSRLDRVLWTSFAERLIGPTLAQALCERSFGENSTRYAGLMAR